MRLFESWREQRNERSSSEEENIPDGLLVADSPEDLCRWLCTCVNELRKGDGSEYTPRSICQFISGLQRYVNQKQDVPVRLADPTNPLFKDLHRVLDKRYRNLHAQGIGAMRRQAEVVTSIEEERLWECGVFSSDSPSGLLRAVFYYNGLNFVLRGGEEHRCLKISQLKFRDVPDPEHPGKTIRCVDYTKHGSKNRPGGKHQLNQENKVVTQFANEGLGERCHVFLLELYLSKLPDTALLRDIFYMKPRVSLDSASDPWYMNIPMGRSQCSWNIPEKYLTEGRH